VGICRTGTLCSWRRTVWSERGGTATNFTIDFDVLPCVAQSYTAVNTCCEPNVKVPGHREGIHHGTRQGDAESPEYGDLSAVWGLWDSPGKAL
jgi:hypothetical protein